MSVVKHGWALQTIILKSQYIVAQL